MCETQKTHFTITRTIVVYPVGTDKPDEKRAETGKGKKNTRKRLINVFVKVIKFIMMMANIYQLIDKFRS